MITIKEYNSTVSVRRFKILHIICFGNDLHGDDGYGPAVYQQLIKHNLPNTVQVFNGGIAGLNALSLFEHCQAIILVDAMSNPDQLGELEWFEDGQLPDFGVVNQDSHGIGIPYLLRAAQSLIKPLPPIHLLVVNIARVQTFSPGLSSLVAASIEPSITRLLAQVNHS